VALATPAHAAPRSSAHHRTQADRPAAEAGQRSNIVIEAGSGRIVELKAPASNLFVANPKVTEVRPASATSLFVFGIAPGRTTVAALDAHGRSIAQWQVTVRPSGYAASEATLALAGKLHGGNVRLHAQPNGLAADGAVASPADADRVLQTAQNFVDKGQTVENRMVGTSPIQVNLKVRIAEMDRSVVRAMGINWSAAGDVGATAVAFATANPLASFAPTPSATLAASGTNFSAVLEALAQDNLVHMLAEPNLTAMSGQTASFLVGGEYPIPVAEQNNTISVSYKQYGVTLSFVPTVLSNNRINLVVAPEVSALTDQGAVSSAGVTVPALTVRRAKTTVELGSGQTFAIAGLLQDNISHDATFVPWLGEIPILGALFRSDSFQRNETELVVLVTPYIVKPVSTPGRLRAPTDGYQPPNDIERIFLLRQQGHGTRAVPMHLPGNTGFIVQ
jgi:pilus assembly protein CpaC